MPKEKVEATEVHWHSTAVNDLCWAEGSEDYYSVGKEGVLVEYLNGKNDFHPRLGAMKHLVVSPSYKCTVHDDNC